MKKQGSIKLGVVSLMVGVFFLFAMITAFIALMVEQHASFTDILVSNFLIIVICALIVGGVLITLGTMVVFRGIRGQYVKKHGVKSSCVVEEVYSFAGRSGGPISAKRTGGVGVTAVGVQAHIADDYGMKQRGQGSKYCYANISYVGESGEAYMLKVQSNALSSLLPGSVIECYIHKENCFVDTKNVVVLEKPKKQKENLE